VFTPAADGGSRRGEREGIEPADRARSDRGGDAMTAAPRNLVSTVVLLVVAAGLVSVAPAASAAVTCAGHTVTIWGTAGNDEILGTTGPDVIHAGDGDDVVRSRGGDDIVCAGAGNDTIYTGVGNDTLYGGAGADRLVGQRGRDTLYGGPGDDKHFGGPGNDLLVGGNGNDQLRGGLQDDVMEGGAGKNVAWGAGGYDECYDAAHKSCEGPVFLETFDGDPEHPTPFTSSADWTVSVNSRVVETQDEMAGMRAQHSATCAPPPEGHWVVDYEDALYTCKNHMMTAVTSGPKHLRNYAAGVFQPNYVLDFTGEPATISFDVSTERASRRDWFDVWITPYDELLRIPVRDFSPSMQGTPRDGVMVGLRAFSERGSFDVEVVDDFVVREINGPVEWIGYEDFLEPSLRTRTTVEITISKDHIRVGMPDYDFYWVSKPIPGGLDFTRAVVQFTHQSYDVFDCDDGCAEGPNTWHWDNVYLAPAVPITVLHAGRRAVHTDTPSFVTFDGAAPKNAHLQFTGYGFDLQVSYDTGRTWHDIETQHNREIHDWRWKNYWMPVPAGTTRVDFRGRDPWNGRWQVQDISIVSQRRR
jgi:hypothetical protein